MRANLLHGTSIYRVRRCWTRGEMFAHNHPRRVVERLATRNPPAVPRRPTQARRRRARTVAAQEKVGLIVHCRVARRLRRLDSVGVAHLRRTSPRAGAEAAPPQIPSCLRFGPHVPRPPDRGSVVVRTGSETDSPTTHFGSAAERSWRFDRSQRRAPTSRPPGVTVILLTNTLCRRTRTRNSSDDL